jgi:hypothetical protein
MSLLAPLILYGSAEQLFTGSASDDAHVNQSSSGSNYGSDTTNIARYHGGSFGRHFYVTFPQTGVSNVNSATLRLYGSANTGDMEVGIFLSVNNTWDEGTITWDNQPGYEVGPIAVTTVTTTAQYYEWDVSGVSFDAGSNDISFVIRPLPDTDYTFTINSDENGSNKPELVILYGAGTGQTRSIPILPGLAGYGVTGFSPRGWDVVKVTNTNTSGAGSFAEAVSQSNRVVIFETSGTIDINSLEIYASNLMVAGQTAPSPGVILKGEINPMHSSNIVFQHLSIFSDFTTETDCVTIGNGDTSRFQTRIVFDHCWFAFASDEQADTWVKQGDFHFEYCVFGPSGDSFSKKYGALFGGDAVLGSENCRVSLNKCLFLHNAERNPLTKIGICTINNCIVYNGGDPHRIYISSREPTHTCFANVTGCLIIDGPSTTTGNKPIYVDPTNWVSGSQLWVSGNQWEGNPITTTEWDDYVELNAVTGAQAISAIDWPTGMTTDSTDNLENDILSNVGPKYRPTFLLDYINEVSERGGAHISGALPSIPTLNVNRRVLNPPSNNIVEVSGYTTLEEWLHSFIGTNWDLVTDGPFASADLHRYNYQSAVFDGSGNITSWDDGINSTDLGTVISTNTAPSDAYNAVDFHGNGSSVYTLTPADFLTVRYGFFVVRSDAVAFREGFVSRTDNGFYIRRNSTNDYFEVGTASWQEYVRINGQFGSLSDNTFNENEYFLVSAKNTVGTNFEATGFGLGLTNTANDDHNWQGQIKDVIMVNDNTNKALDDLLRIEGQLSRTHGFSLDVGHPYRNGIPTTNTRTILFIVESETSGVADDVDDANMVTFLEDNNWTVTVVDDLVDRSATAVGYDVVLVSDSCSDFNGADYEDMEVPMVLYNHLQQAEVEFTSGTETLTSSQTTLEMNDNTHPITGLLGTGAITLLTSGGAMGETPTANLGAGATVLMIDTSGGTDAAMYCFESGATLDGAVTVNARRAFLPHQEDTISNMTEEFELLTLTTLAWAAGFM